MIILDIMNWRQAAIIGLFTIFLAFPAFADRQIAKVKGERFYYCKSEKNQVFVRKFSREGDLISQRKVRKRLAKNIILRNLETIDQINTKKKETPKKKKNKRARLNSKIELHKTLVQNMRKCINGGAKKDKEFDPQPIDINDPAAVENKEFNLTSELEGPLSGSCNLYGANLSVDKKFNDPLLAPMSGVLKCTLSSHPTKDLVVKIFAKNSISNPELLASEKIVQDRVTTSNTFLLSLCKVEPACLAAKKVAAAVETVGIKIEIEELD